MSTTRPDGTYAAATLMPAIEAALPRFLERQRWFAAKGKPIERIAIARRTIWRDWLWLQIDVVLRDAQPLTSQTYSLPLAIAPDGAVPPDAADLVAHVDATLIYDAFSDTAFCHALLAAMRAGERCADGDGGLEFLEFSATAAFARLAGDDLDAQPVRRASASSSNTTVLVGDRLFLKAYRRLAAGINPEVEVGRFLTDTSPYAHIAPLAGALEHRRGDGTVVALIMVQGQVANGSDAWSATLADLRARLATGKRPDAVQQAADWRRWSTLGQRTAELHRALARTTGDADFDPQPVSAADVERWTRKIADEARQTLGELAERIAQLPVALHAAAHQLLAARPQLLARLVAPIAPPVDALVTRYHGDYHLGQVLATDDDDFVIIDFEGEPSRPLAERRCKHSPLRDVAGMLRSFNYAASSALGERAADAADDVPHARLAELAERAELAADWERRAVAAFLDGYRAVLPPGPAGPENPEHAADAHAQHALLELFLLEKALYELRYELNHRPDWVHVPLGGLLGLLEPARDTAPG